MAVATTQMNVRIPAEVKTAGDRAFASEGLTPTEVVRCVWEKAASRGRGLQEVLDLVRGKPGESVALNLFESASCDVTFQMRGLGVDLSAADASHPSDDELLEMAYYEKAVQRGAPVSEEGTIPAGPRILVDTNVWVDAFLGHRSGHKDAMAFLAEAQRASAQLVYPIGALQDVFAILIMELKRKTREVRDIDEACMSTIRRVAWGCVDTLREGATAVGADESDAWLACKYRKLNWDLEDNMVLAAAKRAEVDYLVTSDRVLLAKANVAAMTPADTAALLGALDEERRAD